VIGRATAYPVTSAAMPARTRGAANTPVGGKEPG
jgi:hypothetical protein